MKIKSPLIWKTAGLLGSFGVRNWMGTIDFKAVFYDPNVDPAFFGENRQFILLFWHEHILCPLFVRRNSDVTMLLSQHGDAEIVGQFAKLLGMRCVRGSSNRGGATAIKKLLREQSQNIIAFTPDGPRGPRRKMAIGPIYLASRTQLPIMMLGIGYDRPWRAKSWDRFAVPRPFSRGRMIFSPLLNVPEKLRKDDLEYFREKFETVLTQLTDEAEDWATSGTPKQGESIICTGPKCSLMYHGYNRQATIR